MYGRLPDLPFTCTNSLSDIQCIYTFVLFCRLQSPMGSEQSPNLAKLSLQLQTTSRSVLPTFFLLVVCDVAMLRR